MGLLVAADQFIPGNPEKLLLIVIVFPVLGKLFASNMAVSCGNGILAPTPPPDVADHLPPVSQAYEADAPCTQYLFTGVVKVIPEFAHWSPRDVPVHVPAVPAVTVPEKLAFVKDTEPLTVKVIEEDALSSALPPLLFAPVISNNVEII